MTDPFKAPFFFDSVEEELATSDEETERLRREHEAKQRGEDMTPSDTNE